MKNKRCLFITWDGPQVNYLEALFLPIFTSLQASGHQFFVLQFTWGEAGRASLAEEACKAAGIPYRKVHVWRSLGGIGPFFTALIGARHIRKAVRDWNVDTLMPRSLMPALATLFFSDRRKLRILFDADGLAADERVDFANLSPSGLTYRLLRDVEAQMVRQSNGVIVRSEAAIATLVARAGAGNEMTKFTVVTNGRDVQPYVDAFEKSVRKSTKTPFTVCYVGSVGVKYGLDKMIEVVFELKKNIPDLQWKIFTGSAEKVWCELRKYSTSDMSWISVDFLASDDLASALVDCDLGLAFPQKTYSMHSVTLTKLGDYMLAGVPVIGTGGVGDIDSLEPEGVFLESNGTNHQEILNWICKKVIPFRKEIRQRCYEIGIERYSLENTVNKYQSALNKIE